MTGIFFLDWAIMAVSLFNTIVLFWLGLTVLLNAESRTWGIWLTGGGLLMGGIFFVSHSALLGHDLHYVSQGMDFWWRTGWIPVVASPFAWYVMTLWYAGFWDAVHLPLRNRHRLWFSLTVVLAIVMLVSLVFANPLPSYSQVAQLNLSAVPALGGMPILILTYPFYNVLCITLAVDALRRPGPSPRVMGDLARRRARPWLMAASVMLLLVSLLVAGVMLWIVQNARVRASGLVTQMAMTIAWLDLLIAGLIGGAVLLLGRAIVSYEVFTGKTLPQRGLFRHWRNAVILAAGYSLAVGGSLAFRLRPIYSLLLTTVLMTIFYGLFSHQSYVERERYIEHLRPFVTSQRLYERLLTPVAQFDTDGWQVDEIRTPFFALCRDILETRSAHLLPVGPLALLLDSSLSYPAGQAFRQEQFPGDLSALFDSPQTLYVSLDPPIERTTWAVPLWGTRGLIGVLLLGDKRSGGLYTQEEIEIARASGERLIDTQASAEMAHRLMALQRQRLVESQVIDQQTRRVLHDDVLPDLHAAILSLSGHKAYSETLSLLSDTHHRIADLLRSMPTAITPEVAQLGLIAALRQIVEHELGRAFDKVTWHVVPDAERQARAFPARTSEVLFYAAREAIRNAARYGRGDDADLVLSLSIDVLWHDGLHIVIADDGVGVGGARDATVRSGQGLALHTTMMAVIGGTLAVESVYGAYTRVTLTLPLDAALS